MSPTLSGTFTLQAGWERGQQRNGAVLRDPSDHISTRCGPGTCFSSGLDPDHKSHLTRCGITISQIVMLWCDMLLEVDMAGLRLRAGSLGAAILVGQHQQHGCSQTDNGKRGDDTIAESVH